ncbi:MAG: WYL domain-containing protein [Bacteroidia bacterium]|nr:WYL domain-containing protein [Bacteroidia bacterium]
MPKTTNAQLRYFEIDRCLQNKYHRPSNSNHEAHLGCWTLNELAEAVSDALYEKNRRDEGIASRTIRDDIAALRKGIMGKYAPIENIKGVGYRYEDPSFKLTENPLQEDDLNKLKEALGILKQFRGFRYFEDLEVITGNLESKIARTELPIVQVDVCQGAQGLEHISVIRESMKNKTPLELYYRPFDSPEVKTVFHPYLLKEYNNRWFVFGYSNFYKNNGVYALDRIVSIKLKHLESFKEGNPIIIANYFNNIIGVTNKGTPLEDIVFTVREPRRNYIDSKPLHESQRVVYRGKNYTRYCMKLRINNELIAALLSYGPDLFVEKPLLLGQQMGQLTAEMAIIYQNPLS